jgi:hypothetical protein
MRIAWWLLIPNQLKNKRIIGEMGVGRSGAYKHANGLRFIHKGHFHEHLSHERVVACVYPCQPVVPAFQDLQAPSDTIPWGNTIEKEGSTIFFGDEEVIKCCTNARLPVNDARLKALAKLYEEPSYMKTPGSAAM